MAVDLKPAPQTASTTELVTGILNDAQELLKQQLQLFRHEVIEDLKKTRDASIMLGIGAGLGLLGAIMFAFTPVYAVATLFPHLPLWGSFALWTVAFLAGAGILFMVGIKKLSHVHVLPEESAQALKENVQWITNPK